MSEFARLVDLRQSVLEPHVLAASQAECAALAKRFDLVAVERLTATVALTHEGETLIARGRFEADIVQSCAISGEDLAVRIAEPIHLRFVPGDAGRAADEEVELDAGALDEIAFTGTSIDLGEAVAQSLALAIDPFAEGPEAERVRREVLGDQRAAGPFAALAKLKEPD